MKTRILLPILISLFLWEYTPVYGVEGTINQLPTRPVKKPRVVYLKWGRKLLCDYVWRDGNTLFVVVHGKEFAVGYDPKEIDLERSFGTAPKGATLEGSRALPVVALYEKSGMEVLINQLGGLYLSGLDQHRSKLPPELFNALQRAGRHAFQAAKMRNRALATMKNSCDPELAQEVLDWLLSPLGQEITALESIQFSSKTVQEVQTFAKQLQSNPPPQERYNLIRRLDAATGASEKNVEVALEILVQTATAMQGAFSKGGKISVEEMRRQMALRRPQLEEDAKKTTQVSLTYLYRTLTDRELERYVSFSESKTGTAYHKMAFEALMAALSEAAEENEKAVSKIMADHARREGG
jgi:hypothetical protein